MFRFLLFIGILLVFCSSCQKSKLKSPDAAFIIVSEPVVQTTVSVQGSNSSKITDIWYYVDDEFKGIFPVGSIMPVLQAGDTKITMFAGIKNNGISATRLPYEFYHAAILNQNFEIGKTYTVNPVFEYVTSAIFPRKENFDGSGFIFKSVGDSSYTLISNPNKVFGGAGKSVFMSMSDAKPTAQMITTSPLNLPVGGAPVYLELNYKCNQPFVVGVVGGGTEVRTALTVNTSSEWNKIYVQLTAAVSTQPTYAYYDIFIKATKQTDTPEIYIDNVKLVTR